MKEKIHGLVYVLGDDVDTDQIIPAQFLTFDPTIAEERRMFGVYALSGVPPAQAGLPKGQVPFVTSQIVMPGVTPSPYKIIVAGRNFGCGSSREHAPLAIAEAGVEAVIAEFYARIFFRNSVNGGYLVPFETPARLIDKVSTGDEVELDLKQNQLRNITTGETYALKALGDILPILEAGDVFEYARRAGMLAR